MQPNDEKNDAKHYMDDRHLALPENHWRLAGQSLFFHRMKPQTSTIGIILLATLMGFGSFAFGAEPFFDGLGVYQRTVTTKSPEAQKYFNQGLAFLHGFNHGEAIRSFQEAERIDPSCAMVHWGIAYASGPHINFPM